jgi:hypothetical protein
MLDGSDQEVATGGVPQSPNKTSSQDNTEMPIPGSTRTQERVEFPTETKPPSAGEDDVTSDRSDSGTISRGVSSANSNGASPAPIHAHNELVSSHSPATSHIPPGSSANPREFDPLKGQVGLGIVILSGGGDFETIRGWCDNVTKVRSIPVLNHVQYICSHSSRPVPGIQPNPQRHYHFYQILAFSIYRVFSRNPRPLAFCLQVATARPGHLPCMGRGI